MRRFENIEVPFKKFGNRQCLTAEQIENEPWLATFISKFPVCFEYDIERHIWIYHPDGDAPR